MKNGAKTDITQDDLIFANRFGVLILSPVEVEREEPEEEGPKFSHLGGILFALCVGMAIWTGILWHWLK